MSLQGPLAPAGTPVLYSPEVFVAIAIDAQAFYLPLADRYPPGTVNDLRNDYRRAMENAIFCAQWMFDWNIAPSHNVGPFMSHVVRRNQSVTVKKGARIFSTHSSWPDEGKIAARAQTIAVHRFDDGYIRNRDLRDPKAIQNAQVRWAGAGGYWKWTDINNIELNCL